MRVRRHATVRSFLDAAEAFLLRNEGENFLMLGLCAEGVATKKDPLLVTLEDGGEVIAGAVRWPPRPLIVTRAPDTALGALVDDIARDLAAGDDALNSVMAPAGTAESFAELWTRRTSIRARPGFRQGAFQLERVEPDLRPCPGRLRLAREADLDRAEDWIRDFEDEVGMPMGSPRRIAEVKVADGTLFLWDDGAPVTMAAAAGPTPNGVRVNLVYTPPELRGRGYATACVAALSQHLLDGGRRYCFLYTDLANPTSNRIYQRIGYRAVCEVNEYRFD